MELMLERLLLCLCIGAFAHTVDSQRLFRNELMHDSLSDVFRPDSFHNPYSFKSGHRDLVEAPIPRWLPRQRKANRRSPSSRNQGSQEPRHDGKYRGESPSYYNQPQSDYQGGSPVPYSGSYSSGGSRSGGYGSQGNDYVSPEYVPGAAGGSPVYGGAQRYGSSPAYGGGSGEYGAQPSYGYGGPGYSAKEYPSDGPQQYNGGDGYDYESPGGGSSQYGGYSNGGSYDQSYPEEQGYGQTPSGRKYHGMGMGTDQNSVDDVEIEVDYGDGRPAQVVETEYDAGSYGGHGYPSIQNDVSHHNYDQYNPQTDRPKYSTELKDHVRQQPGRFYNKWKKDTGKPFEYFGRKKKNIRSFAFNPNKFMKTGKTYNRMSDGNGYSKTEKLYENTGLRGFPFEEVNQPMYSPRSIYNIQGHTGYPSRNGANYKVYKQLYDQPSSTMNYMGNDMSHSYDTHASEYQSDNVPDNGNVKRSYSKNLPSHQKSQRNSRDRPKARSYLNYPYRRSNRIDTPHQGSDQIAVRYGQYSDERLKNRFDNSRYQNTQDHGQFNQDYMAFNTRNRDFYPETSETERPTRNLQSHRSSPKWTDGIYYDTQYKGIGKDRKTPYSPNGRQSYEPLGVNHGRLDDYSREDLSGNHQRSSRRSGSYEALSKQSKVAAPDWGEFRTSGANHNTMRRNPEDKVLTSGPYNGAGKGKGMDTRVQPQEEESVSPRLGNSKGFAKRAKGMMAGLPFSLSTRPRRESLLDAYRSGYGLRAFPYGYQRRAAQMSQGSKFSTAEMIGGI